MCRSQWLEPLKSSLRTAKQHFTTTKTSSRRRVPVEPGKSASSEEVSKFLEETQKKKNKNKKPEDKTQKKRKIPTKSRKANIQDMSTSESEAEDLIFDDSTDTPSEDDLDDELSFEEPCSSKQSRRADKVVQNETLFALDEFVIVNYEGTLFP